MRPASPAVLPCVTAQARGFGIGSIWGLMVSARIGGPRIETLTREAVAAVRTLTLNLTRLSRAGVGSASRRADFLRLAQFFARSPEEAPRLAVAAFGLSPSNHYGTLAADAWRPVPTATSWWDAPRARSRSPSGNAATVRRGGGSTPIPDRTRERTLLERRRAEERARRERADFELLDQPVIDGRTVSAGALRR